MPPASPVEPSAPAAPLLQAGSTHALLRIEALRLRLGGITPVDGVSFSIAPGECVGLVGESGCGKSLTALSITGLTRSLPGARIEGRLLWQPRGCAPLDLAALGERELLAIRGAGIGMVFQDPLSCLNPLMPAGAQIAETIAAHTALRGRARQARVLELLEHCGVPQPALRARQYPHQLSGGLRQRVMLAIALAAGPRLLIADEPTTALDVTVQAQVLATLRRLMAETGLSVLFITHDLGVVAQLCSRVLVMYAGRIVEEASAADFFSAPRHPYSRGLLASLPAIASREVGRKQPLPSIPGQPPRPGSFPPGCRFAPRCSQVHARCAAPPPLLGAPGRCAACWLLEGGAAQST